MINCYHFSLSSGSLYVVIEFAPNGNLRQFLKERRPTREYPTTLTAVTDRWPVRENSSTLTHMDLVSFSYQVCRGMEYLSSKKVCHHSRFGIFQMTAGISERLTHTMHCVK